MKIYVSHSRSFDFKKELYPAIEHALRSHKLSFPYKDNKFVDSKKAVSNADLVIAEVSISSTGVGIELGWANLYQIPILAIWRKGTKVSNSVKLIAKRFFEYSDSQDLAAKIEHEINQIER